MGSGAHLADDGLDAPVHCSHMQNVATRVRAPPNPDSRGIYFGQSLGISYSVGDVAYLDTGYDLLAWLAVFHVARAKASVVIDEAGQRELRREVFREGVEIHLLEGGKPVRHHQARTFPSTSLRGRQVQPPAEGDLVVGLKFNVSARHGGQL